jgi:hypothetical protein
MRAPERLNELAEATASIPWTARMLSQARGIAAMARQRRPEDLHFEIRSFLGLTKPG